MGLIDLLPTVHLFKPGARHRRQLLSSKAADPSEELGEPRIIGPAVLAIPVRQGREAPQRCQHIQRWTRANRNETIDRPPAAATRDHRRTPTQYLAGARRAGDRDAEPRALLKYVVRKSLGAARLARLEMMDPTLIIQQIVIRCDRAGDHGLAQAS